MEKALQAPPGTDPRLLLSGGPHYLVFPSVFGLLRQLTEQGRPHTLVIRTFGTDLAEVAAVRQLRHGFWTISRAFASLTPTLHAGVCYALPSGHADRVLAGACDPML